MGEILYYILIFPLEQILDWALFTLFKATKNYGFAIILLSLLVNLFLLKLFIYTDKKAKYESDLKTKLDNRIKNWKKVYSKAKVFAFTQTLYKQNNYHPLYALRSLGGLALQIPFFIAMYQVINNASYLNGINFLWINDLYKPDLIFNIHLLPILMTLFTLINVFYLSKELSARLQGIAIALLFLVLLYNMPSALVLYWTTNTIFSLLKTIVKKIIESKNKNSLVNDNSKYNTITNTNINTSIQTNINTNNNTLNNNNIINNANNTFMNNIDNISNINNISTNNTNTITNNQLQTNINLNNNILPPPPP